MDPPKEVSADVQNQHPTYRSDLDGLRAVAVMLVVFFHAGFSVVPGGYVGVDVFFVLSGYFMASIIWRELETGSFSVVDFYVRRIRRILPAMFAMIAITYGFTLWLFMPQELISYAKSAKAAALLYPNIHFRREAGYFDLAALSKPLLHTWSLGVEEQFYLLFPAFMLVTHRFWRGGVLKLIIFFLTVSLCISAYKVFHDQDGAFYLLPYRLWEFLIGAVISIRRPTFNNSASANTVFSLGIGSLAVATLGYNQETVFPGASALLPCLGSAMIVASGHRSSFANLLLGNSVMRAVGKISYSVYLWHWPIIVFIPYFEGSLPSALHIPVIVALSLIAGMISWRMIETPFRYGPFASKNPIKVGMCVILVMSVIITPTSLIVKDRGLPTRLTGDAQRLYATKDDGNPFSSQRCFIDPDGNGLTLEKISSDDVCSIGAAVTKPQFILWGDSHAAAIAPGLDLVARENAVGGLFVGSGGCPPLPNANFGSRPDRVARCLSFNEEVLKLIERSDVRYVLLAAYWPKYVHRAELPTHGLFFDPNAPAPLEDHAMPVRSALDELIARLTRIEKLPVVILDVPEMGYNVPENLARLAMMGRPVTLSVSRQFTDGRQDLARQVFKERAARGVLELLDPIPLLCDDAKCPAVSGGTVLYKDGDHLSFAGAVSTHSFSELRATNSLNRTLRGGKFKIAPMREGVRLQTNQAHLTTSSVYFPPSNLCPVSQDLP